MSGHGLGHHIAKIKVSARAMVSSEAQMRKDPLQSSHGCRQHSLPCRVSDSGPQLLATIVFPKWTPASSKSARDKESPCKVNVTHPMNIPSPLRNSNGQKQITHPAHFQGKGSQNSINARRWGWWQLLWSLSTTNQDLGTEISFMTVTMLRSGSRTGNKEPGLNFYCYSKPGYVPDTVYKIAN